MWFLRRSTKLRSTEEGGILTGTVIYLNQATNGKKYIMSTCLTSRAFIKHESSWLTSITGQFFWLGSYFSDYFCFIIIKYRRAQQYSILKFSRKWNESCFLWFIKKLWYIHNWSTELCLKNWVFSQYDNGVHHILLYWFDCFVKMWMPRVKTYRIVTNSCQILYVH